MLIEYENDSHNPKENSVIGFVTYLFPQRVPQCRRRFYFLATCFCCCYFLPHFLDAPQIQSKTYLPGSLFMWACATYTTFLALSSVFFFCGIFLHPLRSFVPSRDVNPSPKKQRKKGAFPTLWASLPTKMCLARSR